MSKSKQNNSDQQNAKIAPEQSSQVQILVSKILKGIRTEVIAGGVLIPKSNEDLAWNSANDRTVRIIDQYIRGKGLFQLP